MTVRDDNLAVALALASAGIKLFPAGQDKRPLIAGWQAAATVDADTVRSWWDHMAALPAIPCGQNNFVVIDCDRHEGGADGVAAFKSLVTKHGALPREVPMIKTPNGGLHLYFKQPNGEAFGNGRGSLPPGIDIRGNGGFTIGPGARLPDGRGWTVVPGRNAIKDAPPLLPWIVDMLRPPQHELRDQPKEETSEDRGRAYAVAALKGIEAELAAAPPGERNDRLYKTAFRLATMAARGWLMESEIAEALFRAAESNNYLREHGHRATSKTIESGICDGLKVPHDELKDRDDGPAHARAGNGADHHEQKHQQQGKEQKRERTQRTRTTGDWAEPDMSILDDRRGELPELPIEAFPQAMHRWLRETAAGAGVTIDHIATPLIGIVSSQIGISRRVQATKSWLTPMTCWACLLGLSGSGKTPALDTVKRVLSLIERNRRGEISALQLAHETRVEAAKAALKKWKDDVATAIENGQPPPPKPAEALDVGPFVAPRLYVNDVTIERLAPLLEARPHGMVYIADELARLFLNMQRYSNGSDREFWLESWNGGAYTVERQGRPPIVLPYLLVGVIAGFQPDKLSRCFEGDADGIYARFLYSWPREPVFELPADNVDEVDPEIINAFGRILRLPVMEDGVFVPRNMPLSRDASGGFVQFLHFLHRTKAELDGREREYWCKGSAHVLRIAGTLCLLEWAWSGGAEPQAIEARHVESAVTLWRDYYWPHGCAALRQMGLTDKHAEARAVLRWIRANDRHEVSLKDVRREALKQRFDAGDTQAIVEGLVRAGWLRQVTTKTAGRAVHRFEVNPLLLNLDLGAGSAGSAGRV
jgi:hypothetical protein